MQKDLWSEFKSIFVGDDTHDAIEQAESSFRWLAIFLGFSISLFRFSSPFFGRDRYVLAPAWVDTRMFAIIWAVLSGIMHFPVGSSSDIEDLKTKLFLSSFVIIMTLTQLIITAFSLVHHMIAWILHMFKPDLSDAFWFRGIRPKKSTRTAFQTSALLSTCMSLLIVVCDDLKEEQTNSYCVQYLPSFFAFSNDNISESFFGTYFGRLSLIESPVGVLWISAIAFYILQYTLQRTRRMVHLNQKRKSLTRQLSSRIGSSFKRSFSMLRVMKKNDSIQEDDEDVHKFKDADVDDSILSLSDHNGNNNLKRQLIYKKTMSADYSLWESGSDFDASDIAPDEPIDPIEEESDIKDHPSVSFLPMTEWYSLQVAEIGFQLLLTLKVILNRFDMRIMEAALMKCAHCSKKNVNHLEVDERFAKEDELWFDWIADTGDGGDPTYCIARMLAQPSLTVKVKKDVVTNSPSFPTERINERRKSSYVTLPRANLLLIGGDLAYPLGTMEEYENRLFRIFSFAMEPPPTYSPHDISFDGLNKDIDSSNVDQNGKKKHGPPIAYAIPGNHDWIDGLNAFNRCILQREWLGGWNLPQRRSYFAIKLPHKFWLFGFDNALNEDIDAHQYQYFARVAHERMAEDDKCIFATHEPSWIADAYFGTNVLCPNLKHLMKSVLKGRVVLRIGGDIHNYMRHTATNPDQMERKSEGAPTTLIVSGGGGAFLHPTHSFPQKFTDLQTEYELTCAYPSIGDSQFIGFTHLGGTFRMLNWRSDLIFAVGYFAMIASLLPRCSSNIRDIMLASNYPEAIVLFLFEIVNLIMEIFASSVSTCAIHSLVHISAAISLLLLIEISVEVAHRDKLAGNSYYSSFEQFRSFEQKYVPISQQTDGLILKFIKELLRFLDLPEAMAYTRTRLCATTNQNGYVDLSILTRYETIMYYFGYFLYMSILSVDVCSLIIGWYFYIMSSFFHLHWNESFSSVRYPHRKHFIRFHITKTGTLESWVIGVDKVPTDWRKDPNYKSIGLKIREGCLDDDPSILSYNSKVPSRWIPVKEFESSKPYVVDHFTIDGN